MMNSAWDEGDFYDVSFAVGKSRRYHAYMRDFYARWRDIILTVTTLAGTSAFIALVKSSSSDGNSGTPLGLARWLTGVVAAASVLDQVFKFRKKAELHDDLCKRFTELAAKIVSWPSTSANLAKACAERIRIEAKEPTERRLIDLRAQNDECRARGVKECEFVPLNWLQKSWLAYFFTFGMSGLERRREHQRALRPSDS